MHIKHRLWSSRAHLRHFGYPRTLSNQSLARLQSVFISNCWDFTITCTAFYSLFRNKFARVIKQYSSFSSSPPRRPIIRCILSTRAGLRSRYTLKRNSPSWLSFLTSAWSSFGQLKNNIFENERELPTKHLQVKQGIYMYFWNTTCAIFGSPDNYRLEWQAQGLLETVRSLSSDLDLAGSVQVLRVVACL